MSNCFENTLIVCIILGSINERTHCRIFIHLLTPNLSSSKMDGLSATFNRKRTIIEDPVINGKRQRMDEATLKIPSQDNIVQQRRLQVFNIGGYPKDLLIILSVPGCLEFLKKVFEVANMLVTCVPNATARPQ
ncbi:hypothetical protein ACOME3_007905 [Neoechinorhynchus agilis]